MFKCIKYILVNVIFLERTYLAFFDIELRIFPEPQFKSIVQFTEKIIYH